MKSFFVVSAVGSGGEGRNSVRKPRYFSRPFSERGKIFEDVKYLRAKKKGFPFKGENSIFWTVSALSLLPKRAERERERERGGGGGFHFAAKYLMLPPPSRYAGKGRQCTYANFEDLNSIL